MKNGICMVVAFSALFAGAGTFDVQSRIDEAAAKGGGRVVVPPGTWQTGKIHLRSNVELHLSEGSVLEFSTNPDEYLPLVKTSWQGEEMMGLSPLVYAYGATNVAITGKGMLKTENGPWRTWMKEQKGRRRPQFVQFFACRSVRLEGFSVRGTPFWTIHLYRTDDATVEGLDVSAYDSTGLAMMNSDGIDLECARRVKVRNCVFHQGDDAVVLKSGRDEDGIRRGIPTEDVLIEDCLVREGHTLLGIGSEVGGGIRNVTMRRCRVKGGVNNLLYFKTNAKRGGFMKNIRVEDVVADRVRGAVVGLTANYWYTPRPGVKNLHRTRIEDIAIRNVRVDEAALGIDLEGDPELAPDRIAIEGVKIGKVTRKIFQAMNVKHLAIGGIVVDEGPVVGAPPHVGGQEPDPPTPVPTTGISAETRVVAKRAGTAVGRIQEDLVRPVIADSGKMAWNATLAEVARLDKAADAQWAACGDADAVKARQAVLKKMMTDAIGGFPERSPLNPVVVETIPREGYRIEKVYFESLPRFYVTGLFYRPNGAGPFPAVVIACGHSGNGKGSKGYQRACVQLAKAGISAFIYDPVDQGERTQLPGDGGNVYGHNRVGIRAALLGWSMARFRVWDAMRALDYLESRSDVDHGRLGMMGNSGGGTLTSLTMALDPRIRAAAPSCYLSTLRAVCEDCGPQDAEQNIFGQLSFGLNHLGYVAMRAPLATLMACKEKDFFPIRGSRETKSVASGVFAVTGGADALAMFTAPGGHGWVESTRTASVAWMRKWLKDERNAFGEKMYPWFVSLDGGFDLETVDFGLNPGFEVSPGGNVRNLPGAVTAYDIMRAEALRQKETRPRLTSELVRKVAGIRSSRDIAETAPKRGCPAKSDGYTSASWQLNVGDGMTLTAVELVPTVAKVDTSPVLLLPSEGRGEATAKTVEFLREGRKVLVADLRGFGETCAKGHLFYGSDYPEEGVAAMTYLMGWNLVSLRAEDAICLARAWAKHCGEKSVEVVSFGRATIPLAHAVAAEPNLFAAVSSVNPPPPWRIFFAEDNGTVHYADVVNGAWRFYDWTDLLAMK